MFKMIFPTQKRKGRGPPLRPNSNANFGPSRYTAGMTASDFRIRRATVDDLPTLRTLWAKSGLQPMDLEKRVTEMQVAELADGQVVGALGLKIERLHGQVHSEIILDAAHQVPLREAFWQRLQILARNHGLFRLWTQLTNPFWAQLGFKTPTDKEREKMPASFAGAADVFTLALKEDSAEGLSVEKEFELFTQAQKMETERLMQQAQAFRKFAYILLGTIIGGLFLAAVFRFFKVATKRRPRP
jgi:N-acetylglutamate synthase-like GNAT family acetyltransferase